MVLKWDISQKLPKLVDDYEAIFHTFGIDYEELRDGVGNYSTCIVEKSDGTIMNIPVMLVRFMQPIQWEVMEFTRDPKPMEDKDGENTMDG